MRASSLLSLLPLALALLGACGGDADRPDSAPDETPVSERFGGTAVVAGIVDLQTMNSLTVNETLSRTFQNEVLFAPLIRYDSAFNVVPWLAERWDTTRVAPDTLELTFSLRRDVRWHDGRPTTAEDVRFTYEAAVDPELGSALGPAFRYYSPRAGLIDPYTISFRLRPHAEFLDGWTQMAVMPAHILAGAARKELATHPFGTTSPVGNGPFRFARRIPGQEWVFEANGDFPPSLGGRPFLDRLVYRVIPEPNTLLTEALTGGIDMYVSVNASQADRLSAPGNMELRTSPSPNLTFIAWNGKLPLFDTEEERRALSMAIDRNRMVSALLHGHGELGRATVTPAHWAFDREGTLAILPYSPDSARALLARRGWLDRDRDGTLEDPSGRPFRFTLKAPAGNQTRIDVMQIVQAQLGQLGIQVIPAVVEGHTLIGQLSGRKGSRGETARDFEAVVMGWTDSFRKDDSNLFHSRNLNGPYQITSFANPRADALLDTLGLIMDRAEARPLWTEYQVLMARKSPETVLYYPRRLTGVSEQLNGVTVDVRGDLVSVARWWIPSAQRGGSTAVTAGQ